MLIARQDSPADSDVLRYLGLCLTACAMVAVLGARQPGAAAWNFVVAGLLVVLLLPLAEYAVAGGQLQLEWFRAALLASVLAVGVVNYLPTGLAPAALVLALGSTLELLHLSHLETSRHDSGVFDYLGCLVLAWTPWIGLAGFWRNPTAASPFDQIWFTFRNRFGLVWGQRLRDQFNRSAAHSGWPVQLTWRGLRPNDEAATHDDGTKAAMLATLEALIKRFGSTDDTRLRRTAG
jgi:hypothetical protein